ncbi:hypothetical protein HPB51_004115 [Rhipicephalus microplus]|uniref:THAP-type domain-containing protein n=1 Tax=Rhipicephalus microplus TaxID=6941 RepID=A0A9J6DZX0_RHIMP|nr:hypothetical protein HPB51_004115 [Rhipicephalus microplus]
MPTCCVPGCTSGYRNDTSPSVRHFFSAPSDERLRAAWNRAIPRADKDLTTKSRVCSIHFHDQDIRKTYVHVINGETVEIPRAFKMSLKQMEAKGPQGVRYTRSWVLNCLLLHISSPKAYNVIRKMNSLPLPTTSRLNQVLSGVPCEYGYNQVVLKALEAFFSSKRDVEECGTLVLDEIKLREGVDFNKSTYKFDGFVEFENTGEKSKAILADHALVLMFIPLFHNWVQPIASFATRGAAPGAVLAKIVVESVLQLERHGATVLGVVSDGAGNNRSMWTHLGISGKLHHPVNKIPHPTLEDGRFLHFLCDVPHIIKCVRNHLLTHTYAKAGTNCINFKHYVHLYEAEKDSHLKIVPKFTSSHVKPSKLEKMNVRLATQVNDLFDVLNAKHPATGIRKNSPKIKVIEDFLVMLNETERNSIEKNTKLFASQLTTESLRVTLMSVLDIITLLLDKDVRYVLTAKLNQDPLEIAILTEMRSFVPGALQLPSKDLTSLLTDVESAITERTRDNVAFGDLFCFVPTDKTFADYTAGYPTRSGANFRLLLISHLGCSIKYLPREIPEGSSHFVGAIRSEGWGEGETVGMPTAADDSTWYDHAPFLLEKSSACSAAVVG